MRSLLALIWHLLAGVLASVPGSRPTIGSMGRREKATVHVCNVLTDDRVGGPQRRVVSVAAQLAPHGFRTTLVLPEGSGAASELANDAGVGVHRLGFSRPTGYRSPLGLLRYGASVFGDIVRFRRLFTQIQADVVHVNGAYFVAPALAARLAGVAVVWHLNDTMFSSRASRALGRFVRMVSTCTIAAAERVAQHYGVDDICYVVHAPVDIEKFAARPERSPDEPPHIGMIANWNPIKGQDTFVEAFARLRERGVDARATLTGAQLDTQQEFCAKVLRRIDQLGLETSIEIKGFEDDPAPSLAALDCFILCSSSEASPTSVHEAMAVGVPVVAFDVGGVAEMVDADGPMPAGLVVAAGDMDALEQAIARVLTDVELHSRLAKNGPARARNHYSVERCAERHRAVYAIASGSTNELDGLS